MNWGHVGAAGRLSINWTTPGINIIYPSEVLVWSHLYCQQFPPFRHLLFTTSPQHRVAPLTSLHMEGNWSSDSLQVLLCWEMLTWKGIKTIPLVDLTLLILLISATRWVTSCYTITHTVQVQHVPIYKCNSYIHKEQLLWCSSPASPKAQLTQDRNEGLLFTISHAGCTEKVKPKPEGWHREKTQKTPWFMWLWSNSPAQPSVSSAVTVNHFCPLPQLHTSWISIVPRWGWQELSALQII